MSYVPTQTEINIIKQSSKEVIVKIELLNKNFTTIETVLGNVLSDNLNVDSESKQRRSYNCDFFVTDSSFFIGDDKKIWIDKYIRVYYGIRSTRTNEIVWWRIGTFTYLDVKYSYGATDNTLSLTCADLMADYDGTKNGQFVGAYKLLIPAGEDIKTTIEGLVKDAGINNYYIEDIGKEIPYDIEFTDSTTYCDIWTKICELYDSWEFYFDVDGKFIWRQKPTGLTEPVSFDDTLLDGIWVQETTDVSFTGIYNVTEVWGQVLELANDDRYAESSTYSDNVYYINLDGITSLDDIDHQDKIAINICADCLDNAMVSINGLDAIPIVHDDASTVVAGNLLSNTVYVFSYRRNMGDSIQNCLYLLGQYQAYGIYKETNPDCPFSIPNLGYEIAQRVNYEDLYSNDLCYNQAEYLTYQTTALMDTITLTLLIIPWLDVNQKISYTSKETGETNQYIIKNFNWSSFDGTMSMTLYKFLESFSYVYNKQNEIERRTYGLRNRSG